MFSGKIIKMDQKEKDLLDEALKLLKKHDEFLEEELHTDDTLDLVYENCDKACAALADYLFTYDDQFTKHIKGLK